jgi:hypothetical protein
VTSRGPRRAGKPPDQLEANFNSPPRFFEADRKNHDDGRTGSAMLQAQRSERRGRQITLLWEPSVATQASMLLLEVPKMRKSLERR